MAARIRLEVKGTAAKIQTIARLDKDVWKSLQTEVRDALGEARQIAQGQVPERPLRNWGGFIDARTGRDLSFDASQVRASFKPKFQSRLRGQFRVVSGALAVKSPAGAIYALAGSRNRSGHRFNIIINNVRGGRVGARNDRSWPRMLGPAWYAARDEAAKQIGRAVEAAIVRSNR